MAEAEALQRVVLKIALHRVELRHAVRDRRAGGEHDAAAAGQLVHVAALHVHVRGLLRLRARKARDALHFCVVVKW